MDTPQKMLHDAHNQAAHLLGEIADDQDAMAALRSAVPDLATEIDTIISEWRMAGEAFLLSLPKASERPEDDTLCEIREDLCDKFVKCSCGSGLPSRWEHDAQGIELCRACDECRERKLSQYRPEILDGYSQADVDEPIDPE